MTPELDPSKFSFCTPEGEKMTLCVVNSKGIKNFPRAQDLIACGVFWKHDALIENMTIKQRVLEDQNQDLQSRKIELRAEVDRLVSEANLRENDVANYRHTCESRGVLLAQAEQREKSTQFAIAALEQSLLEAESIMKLRKQIIDEQQQRVESAERSVAVLEETLKGVRQVVEICNHREQQLECQLSVERAHHGATARELEVANGDFVRLKPKSDLYRQRWKDAQHCLDQCLQQRDAEQAAHELTKVTARDHYDSWQETQSSLTACQAELGKERLAFDDLVKQKAELQNRLGEQEKTIKDLKQCSRARSNDCQVQRNRHEDEREQVERLTAKITELQQALDNACKGNSALYERVKDTGDWAFEMRRVKELAGSEVDKAIAKANELYLDHTKKILVECHAELNQERKAHEVTKKAVATERALGKQEACLSLMTEQWTALRELRDAKASYDVSRIGLAIDAVLRVFETCTPTRAPEPSITQNHPDIVYWRTKYTKSEFERGAEADHIHDLWVQWTKGNKSSTELALAIDRHFQARLDAANAAADPKKG